MPLRRFARNSPSLCMKGCGTTLAKDEANPTRIKNTAFGQRPNTYEYKHHSRFAVQLECGNKSENGYIERWLHAYPHSNGRCRTQRQVARGSKSQNRPGSAIRAPCAEGASAIAQTARQPIHAAVQGASSLRTSRERPQRGAHGPRSGCSTRSRDGKN